MITATDDATLDAMGDRAREEHAAAGEIVAQFKALRAEHGVVTDVLGLVIALHARNRVRCAALGYRPPSLEDTLERYEILPRANFASATRYITEHMH